MKKKLKEFCKKHEKGLKSVSLIVLGGGIVGGSVLIYKKVKDSASTAYICDPIPTTSPQGRDAYGFEFGTISKFGKRNNLGWMFLSPEKTLKFGETVVRIVKTCEEMD